MENSDKKETSDKKNELAEHYSEKHNKDGVTININIIFNIGNKKYRIEQRAEGGGQINKNVGTNANQGGQNALDHSLAENDHSNFANGNGRSGIAGDDNDEAGGQQGIKIRDSELENCVIKSSSEHSESEAPPDELSNTEANE